MQLRYYANEAFQSQVFVARKQRLYSGVVAATINDIYWQICRQQKR
jgi:tetrahydromethanopterin S-methyltransferase subunit F